MANCNRCGKPIEFIDFQGERLAIENRPRTMEFNGTAWVRSAGRVAHVDVCRAAYQDVKPMITPPKHWSEIER